MYKSKFAYTGQDAGVLSFKAGEEFNLLEQVDEHWWTMQNSNGKHGLVPASYLEVNQVVAKEVLDSIDRAIDLVHKNAASKGGALTKEERSNLKKLISHRNNVATGHSFWGKGSQDIPNQPKRSAPKPPESNGRPRSLSAKRTAPSPPSVSTPVASPSHAAATSNVWNIQVNAGAVSPIDPRQLSSPSPQNQGQQVHPGFTAPEARRKMSMERLQGSNVTIVKTVKTTTETVEESASNSSSNKLPSPLSFNNTHSRSGTSNFKYEVSASNSLDTNRNPINSSKVSNMSSNSSQTVSPASDLQSSPSTTRSRDTSLDGSFSSMTISPVSTSHAPSNLSTPTPTRDSVEKVTYDVPDDLGQKLVLKLQDKTNMNFEKSLIGVKCILETLSDSIPLISPAIKKISMQLGEDQIKELQGTLTEEEGKLLCDVLDQLVEHKNDAQQRGWAVHEDFQPIQRLLDKLLQIMEEVDPNICRKVLQAQDFHYLNELVVYFQLESRAALRISLIQVFGCFCQFGANFITQLLCTVLPTELALDIMRDQTDIVKLLTSSLMLTMLFCTAEPVPYHHYVQFNEAFVHYLLDTIEEPPDNDDEDQVPDAFLAILLAFNQHFKAPGHNTVLKTIISRQCHRTFSEKVLLLFNREADPAAMFDFCKAFPDSVMKLLGDLFSSEQSAGIFFTNDMHVLIDIILRQIKDKQEQDILRTEYLSLFNSILHSTNYREHCRHAQEFSLCFRSILSTREQQSDVDLFVVNEIMKNFGDIFHHS